MANKNYSIVIPSCDKYREVWKANLEHLNLIYPNIVNKFLITDQKLAIEDGINYCNLIVNTSNSWQKRLKDTLLNIVKEEYIILVLDDYIMLRGPNDEDIRSYIAMMEINNIVSLRFTPNPLPRTFKSNISYYENGEAYRVSAQLGIWNRIGLIQLLGDKGSAWDFERNGSARSCKTFGNYATFNEPVSIYWDAIQRGHWKPDIHKYLVSKDLIKPTNILPISTYRLQILISIRDLVYEIFPKISSLISKTFFR